MKPPLNRELLPDNTCFGCGLENAHGLQVEIQRDPESAARLVARFTPAERMSGFPNITHGGAIYTVLDCLSTWVATLLGPNRQAAWLLRSAQTTYHRPAPTTRPMTLRGWIREQGGPWDPLLVQAEARGADGELCVEAEFKVVPLSHARFTEIAGIPTLPANWRTFLTGAGPGE
ncbi:MAG: PaaI family thioesterase [Candidatus Polarisedimenticolia bacterium]